LIGLATATPVVCLCVPLATGVAISRPIQQDAQGADAGSGQGGAAGLSLMANRAGLSEPISGGSQRVGDAPALIAVSALAAVSALVASAGELPAAAPWQLDLPVTIRFVPSPIAAPGDRAWSPAVPPPR
jgi:hypothetical protein